MTPEDASLNTDWQGYWSRPSEPVIVDDPSKWQYQCSSFSTLEALNEHFEFREGYRRLATPQYLPGSSSRVSFDGGADTGTASAPIQSSERTLFAEFESRDVLPAESKLPQELVPLTWSARPNGPPEMVQVGRVRNGRLRPGRASEGPGGGRRLMDTYVYEGSVYQSRCHLCSELSDQACRVGLTMYPVGEDWIESGKSVWTNETRDEEIARRSRWAAEAKASTKAREATQVHSERDPSKASVEKNNLRNGRASGRNERLCFYGASWLKKRAPDYVQNGRVGHWHVKRQSRAQGAQWQPTYWWGGTQTPRSGAEISSIQGQALTYYPRPYIRDSYTSAQNYDPAIAFAHVQPHHLPLQSSPTGTYPAAGAMEDQEDEKVVTGKTKHGREYYIYKGALYGSLDDLAKARGGESQRAAAPSSGGSRFDAGSGETTVQQAGASM